MQESKQCKRLVARSRPAEKIDDATLSPGILIAEERENPAGLQHFVRLTRAVALGQNSLPHRLAKAGDEPIEIRACRCQAMASKQRQALKYNREKRDEINHSEHTQEHKPRKPVL